MSWKDLGLRMRALFSRRQMDAELQEELQLHLDMQKLKNQRHDLDPAPARQHFIALGHVLASVVGTLCLNVGANLADQRPHIRFAEDHYSIDVTEGGKNLGALVLRHQRTALALDLPDAE